MRNPLPFVLLPALFALAACGGADATGPGDVAGTYNLQTINDSTLPRTTSESATHKVEVLASAITLKGDGTYTWVQTTRTTDNGTATTTTDTYSDTFSVKGSSITLGKSSGPVSFVSFTDIRIAGDTLTMTIVSLPVIVILVFKR